MRHLLTMAAVLLCAGAPAGISEDMTATPSSCEALAHVALANASITFARVVDAGAFKADGSSSGAKSNNAPAFCRVAATLRPTSDSDIRAEVWLPVSGWNGKYLAVGSGGWGGSINYKSMTEALERGYATSATDDGHTGDSGKFALGHPEKFVDFAYRAEHEGTVAAKAILKNFYGRSQLHSYWNGCSGGGREGILQARRYPEDFDGVIAGDPANFGRNAWALSIAEASFKDSADYIPPSKYAMVHQAVLNACDALDGLKDGLIDDPRRCKFDPKVLECKQGDGPSCLTTRQVQTVRTLLSPAKTKAGVEVFPGLEPGTELRWARLAGGPEPAELFADYFKYVVFKDPNWDWRRFDIDRDAALGEKTGKGIIDMDPDLKGFIQRGGKLLIYQGWADQQVAPVSAIEFYDSAVRATGGAGSSMMRLFMAPGMAHCAGGEGPDEFDKIGAMEQWVERGKAPEQMVAAHKTDGKVDRTRPLCAYPQVAKYRGAGSIDDAANFSCKMPER